MGFRAALQKITNFQSTVINLFPECPSRIFFLIRGKHIYFSYKYISMIELPCIFYIELQIDLSKHKFRHSFLYLSANKTVTGTIIRNFKY